MRFKSCTAALVLLLVHTASFSGAAPFFVIGSGSGSPGSAVTVDFSFNDAGATIDSFEGTITYDNANLTADLSACGGFTNVVPPDAIPSCSDNGSGVITVIGFSGSGSPLTGQSLGSISFTIGATVVPPATFTLDVGGEAFANGGVSVPAGTSTDGTITASAGPGPGVLNVQPPTLALTADVNATPGTGVITISNDGDPVNGDASINPTCSLGPITGTGTISVTAAPTTLAPGTSGTVTASCSGATAGTSTADYTCTATSTGMGGGTPTVTNDTTAISCVLAVGTPAPNPPPGTNAVITVGPVVRGNTGTGALTFTETNNSGGSYAVSCVLTDDGMGAFAISGAAAATVDAATPFTFAVSGTSTQTDPQPSGTATCTYSAGATGTVTIALGIALVPEIVPTMTEWGLILLTLALVGFGAFQLRRRAPLA